MTAIHAADGRSRRMRRGLMVVATILAILILLELCLRAWCFWTGGPVAALARRTPAAAFTFVSNDPWQFHARYGFVGRPGLRYIMGSAGGGNVGCSDSPNSLWPGSDLGPDWTSADMRIAFFGADDALFQPEWDQWPWPSALAEELSRRSGNRVVIANYSRPGVGPVQALTLAADIGPASRSNLVVLAPTTPSLAMDFVYRGVVRLDAAVIPVASASPRMLDDPTLGVPIGPVVNPGVTKLWCEQTQTAARAGMTRLLGYNGILNELQDEANVAALLAAQPVTSDWLSPRPALARVISGEFPVFDATKPTVRMPPRYLAQPELDRDRRATQAAAALRNAGIPVIVLLSPLWPELLERRVLPQYSGAQQEYLDALLTSLERLTGHPALRMVDAVDRDLRPEGAQLVNDPEGDWALRASGVDLYAAFAAKMLMPAVVSALSKSAAHETR